MPLCVHLTFLYICIYLLKLPPDQFVEHENQVILNGKNSFGVYCEDGQKTIILQKDITVFLMDDKMLECIKSQRI